MCADDRSDHMRLLILLLLHLHDKNLDVARSYSSSGSSIAAQVESTRWRMGSSSFDNFRMSLITSLKHGCMCHIPCYRYPWHALPLGCKIVVSQQGDVLVPSAVQRAWVLDVWSTFTCHLPDAFLTILCYLQRSGANLVLRDVSSTDFSTLGSDSDLHIG